MIRYLILWLALTLISGLAFAAFACTPLRSEEARTADAVMQAGVPSSSDERWQLATQRLTYARALWAAERTECHAQEVHGAWCSLEAGASTVGVTMPKTDVECGP